MKRKLILGIMSVAAMVMLVVPFAFAVPYSSGNYNGIFFENAEMFLNNDGSLDEATGRPTVTAGDTFYGILNAQNIKGPSDISGQTGPNIWLSGQTPAEITGYFAVDVVSTTAGFFGGLADLIVFGPAASDPNRVLQPGVSLQLFEDAAGNYNNTTVATGLATALDGTPTWSFGFGASPDGDSPRGYWWTNAPIVWPATSTGTDIGESWLGLNQVLAYPTGVAFTAINDPNESLKGYNVDLFSNVETFQLGAVGQTDVWQVGSNDPGVFMPNAVPEPASLLLLGFGLIGLVGLARKRSWM